MEICNTTIILQKVVKIKYNKNLNVLLLLLIIIITIQSTSAFECDKEKILSNQSFFNQTALEEGILQTSSSEDLICIISLNITKIIPNALVEFDRRLSSNNKSFVDTINNDDNNTIYARMSWLNYNNLSGDAHVQSYDGTRLVTNEEGMTSFVISDFNNSWLSANGCLNSNYSQICGFVIDKQSNKIILSKIETSSSNFNKSLVKQTIIITPEGSFENSPAINFNQIRYADIIVDGKYFLVRKPSLVDISKNAMIIAGEGVVYIDINTYVEHSIERLFEYIFTKDGLEGVVLNSPVSYQQRIIKDYLETYETNYLFDEKETPELSIFSNSAQVIVSYARDGCEDILAVSKMNNKSQEFICIEEEVVLNSYQNVNVSFDGEELFQNHLTISEKGNLKTNINITNKYGFAKSIEFNTPKALNVSVTEISLGESFETVEKTALFSQGELWSKDLVFDTEFIYPDLLDNENTITFYDGSVERCKFDSYNHEQCTFDDMISEIKYLLPE